MIYEIKRPIDEDWLLSETNQVVLPQGVISLMICIFSDPRRQIPGNRQPDPEYQYHNLECLALGAIGGFRV